MSASIRSSNGSRAAGADSSRGPAAPSRPVSSRVSRLSSVRVGGGVDPAADPRAQGVGAVEVEQDPRGQGGTLDEWGAGAGQGGEGVVHAETEPVGADPGDQGDQCGGVLGPVAAGEAGQGADGGFQQGVGQFGDFPVALGRATGQMTTAQGLQQVQRFEEFGKGRGRGQHVRGVGEAFGDQGGQVATGRGAESADDMGAGRGGLMAVGFAEGAFGGQGGGDSAHMRPDRVVQEPPGSTPSSTGW